MVPGYIGRIAWIDLTEETITDQALEERIARKYLEGIGLGAYLPYPNLSPYTDPYDP